MKRYIINFTGKVQGVGFRYFCQMNALKYSLLGSAKNLDNGSVEVIVQGNLDDIKLFLKDVKKGNRFINIKNYSINEIPLDGTLKKFNITY